MTRDPGSGPDNGDRYRSLVAATSSFVWRTDPEGALTEITDSWLALVGLDADEALGWGWLAAVHPEDRDAYVAAWLRALAGAPHFEHEYRLCCADGRVRWFADRAAPVRGEDDRVLEWIGAGQDITETRETEEALVYVSGLQRVLVEQAGRMVGASEETLGEALDEALERIGAWCAVDSSYLVRFSAGRETMTLEYEWCAPRVHSLLGQIVDRPRSAVPALVARLERREPVHIPCLDGLGPEWRTDAATLAEQSGLRSMLAAPVFAGGELQGYLGFDTLGRARSWRDDEIRLLQGMADIIGAALQRDRADRARRESEARFRTIAEHLPGAVYERIDEPDGTVRLTYVSPDIERVFGIDPEAAMADPRVVVRAVHPEDRERYLAAIEASRRARTALDHRHRIVTEGGIVWARVLGRPRVAGAGRVVWDGITIDETERMAAEEALRESRALQEIAGRTARVGGWVADLARDRISLSDEVCAIHGLPRGTTLRLNEGADYYARGWRERIRSAFRACARHATAFDEEAELLTAGGDRLWVRVIGEAVREDSGRVTQVRGALQDITEHKATREEARRLAERLTTTLESITDAFFTLDPEWRFTYINREAERVMARSRDDLLGRNMWQEYPDLRGTRVEQEYAQAIEARRTAEFEFYYPAWETWFEIHAYPSEEGLAIYFRDVTERKRAQAEIEFLALYDPLTHLPNRRLLMDRLGQAIAANARTGQHGAMLFLDLDHFKTVNDTLGHDAGDEMLKEASRRLGQCVRATDTVARFGGDEFAVVLQDLGADAAGAADQAQRIGDGMREGLARPYQLGQHERYTTVSVGVTLFGGHADDDAEDAMKRADLAMYEAKSAGRSALRVFHPSMRTAVQSRVNLESQLRRALREDRIRPHFQPQVDHTGRLIGAEALARWEQSDGDHVSPAEFIPVAEQSGLILQLGAAMLERVCERLAAWKRHPGLADVGVSVNVSAHQFHHPGFVDTVRAVLDRTGAVPGQLWLELTESLLLVDIEDTIDKMHALRDLGVRFTLDDFGTGYSSLAYLKRLPLDQLKIDQGFVRDALTDANDDAIVRTIVVLAQTLGLQVIAEGVETEALRDRLAAHGCTLYQGYLFGRPMSPLALEALARSHVAG